MNFALSVLQINMNYVKDVGAYVMSDPDLTFLFKEEMQSVFYIKEQGTGKILGVEIVTKGHKVTFTTNETFHIDIEDWSESLPKNTKPD